MILELRILLTSLLVLTHLHFICEYIWCLRNTQTCFVLLWEKTVSVVVLCLWGVHFLLLLPHELFQGWDWPYCYDFLSCSCSIRWWLHALLWAFLLIRFCWETFWLLGNGESILRYTGHIIRQLYCYIWIIVDGFLKKIPLKDKRTMFSRFHLQLLKLW